MVLAPNFFPDVMIYFWEKCIANRLLIDQSDIQRICTIYSLLVDARSAADKYIFVF